jgi:uncharacterized protein YecE (DUF72 family)
MSPEGTEDSQALRAAIGTSGFSYRDWKGCFYPEWLPARDWFHFYAARFNAVEINLTFYRSVTEKTLLRWRASTPPEFRFVLKASQTITHLKRLEDCGPELRSMAVEFAPLDKQLACILFQLPPSLRRREKRLDAFLRLAKSALEKLPGSTKFAMEFRHRSWNVPATLDRLAESGWAIVLHDMAGQGGWKIRDGRLEANCSSSSLTAERLVARPIPLLYLRFHGTTGKYAGMYGEAGLRAWVDLSRAALGGGVPVHAYFNNTSSGEAPRDAQVFKSMVHRE